MLSGWATGDRPPPEAGAACVLWPLCGLMSPPKVGGGAESVVQTHISQSGLCGPLESAAMMDGLVETSGAVGGCFLDVERGLRKSLFF